MVEIAGVVGWDDLDNFFVKKWGQPFCPMVVTGVASSLGSDKTLRTCLSPAEFQPTVLLLLCLLVLERNPQADGKGLTTAPLPFDGSCEYSAIREV
jgi:hypothetical protein